MLQNPENISLYTLRMQIKDTQPTSSNLNLTHGYTESPKSSTTFCTQYYESPTCSDFSHVTFLHVIFTQNSQGRYISKFVEKIRQSVQNKMFGLCKIWIVLKFLWADLSSHTCRNVSSHYITQFSWLSKDNRFKYNVSSISK